MLHCNAHTLDQARAETGGTPVPPTKQLPQLQQFIVLRSPALGSDEVGPASRRSSLADAPL